MDEIDIIRQCKYMGKFKTHMENRYGREITEQEAASLWVKHLAKMYRERHPFKD